MTEHSPTLPYKIACLCELRNDHGEILLIHRAKAPNQDLYSPIGGKLDTATGESPAQCAQREIEEEAGVTIDMDRLRLKGIISESAFEGQTHWLMFWYRVEGAVEVPEQEIREGRLEWRRMDELEALPLPETDRRAIWPTVLEHEDGFFTLHIDCRDGGIRWTVEQSERPSAG